MDEGLHIAFFGSSLVSAYWNGAATYYRGLLRALARRGHRITFYEPDAYDRQNHRDMTEPDWARVVVYPAEDARDVGRCLEEASEADWIVKASGVGVFDEWLERAVPERADSSTGTAYWDVDAPATLARLDQNPTDPLHAALPKYDRVLTYGGGAPVVEHFQRLGARSCAAIYNAFDSSTHHPVPPEARFRADLALMANRLPDREARIEEFFLKPARLLNRRRLLLGGSGWQPRNLPANVDYVGHVYTADHNAFNTTPLAVLNVNRASMARNGWSPATRLFEAAAAGSCMISDAWTGLEAFFTPGEQVLTAENGDQVAELMRSLTRERACEIGQAARRRALAEHTYDHRAGEVEAALD